MREILLEHGKRYPLMQAQDAVKLLYQSEFGGGHMIADPARSLERLRGEWQPQVRCADGPSFERIGGGLCRIDLRALDEGLSCETLKRMFVLTAERKTGTIESFEKKLEILRQCCARGEMPFSLEELDRYLEDYRAQGYPAVSHSEVYRQNYRPAYRVAADCYARYLDAFVRIDRMLAEGKANGGTFVVAIDGMSGSGKSTMARVLREIYDCRLFQMDDYFLQGFQRTEERYAQPGGNVDYERFREEVLDHVRDRAGLRYRPFHCGTLELGPAVETAWNRLNIVEGSYSQHPYFGDAYDLRFFCRIPREEQICRIRERNGEEMLKTFQELWIPMENRYFETYGIREKSVEVAGA